MHSKKSLHALFVFLLISTFSFAQNVFVANDFGNCGVGLRDSSGKWLAEPIYQRIDEWPKGYFKVLFGSKEGVLDSAGKMVIQPVYDYIRYDKAYAGGKSLLFFTVMQGKKTGVLNTKNEFVVPLTCRTVSIYADGTIIAEKTKKHYSIYNSDGKETLLPKRQAAPPEPLGDHLFKVARSGWRPEYDSPYDYSEWGDVRGKRELTLKKKYGVMDDSLRIIIPEKFTAIRYDPGASKVIGVAQKNKTGYYSTNGQQIWAPVFRDDACFWQNEYIDNAIQSRFNYLGLTIASYKGKYGIIGMNGDTILPFIYDNIEAPYGSLNRGETWTVTKDGRQGTFNLPGRHWVLPMDFEQLSTLHSFLIADTLPAARSQMALQVIIGKKNGKYGLITSAGQELLPFIYDEFTHEADAVIFRSGDSYLQVSFPSFTALPGSFPERPDGRLVVQAPAALQFRKITATGGVVLFINPDLLADSSQLSAYQSPAKNYQLNSETYDHHLHAAALVISPLSPATNFSALANAWYVHNSDLDYRPEDSCLYYKIYPGQGLYTQSIRQVAKDKFHTYYREGYNGKIFREDGVMLSPNGVYSYLQPAYPLNDLYCFRYSAGKTKNGLIDGNGRLLVDLNYIAVGECDGKYAWVKKKSSFFRRPEWNILDISSNQLLLPAKTGITETNAFGNNAVVFETAKGTHLFDCTARKFILEGKLDKAFPLDTLGNYFAVRTCFGNIGIVSGNGTWLADTCWKTLIAANNVTSSSWLRYNNIYLGNGVFKYSVLSNDTGWIIFDGNKGELAKDAQRRQLLLGMAAKGLSKEDPLKEKKICYSCPSYSFSATGADTLLNAWEEKLLFDSLFTGEHFIADTLFFWKDELCPGCMKKNPGAAFQYGWSKNYERESLHHYISFCNDSCLSLSRTLMIGYWDVSENARDLFFTAMLFDDGPHALLLDSLFEGTEWKKMISDEVTLYFESHPGIEGNCHNPVMLPLMMRDRFVLTKEGILLFPPNYKEYRQQLSVLIPWETAKPYMRKDVIRKLRI